MYFLINNDLWTVALNEWEYFKSISLFSQKSLYDMDMQASKSVIFHFENYVINGKYI